jgi:tetratricopeptide (TPR) repeat protein
MDDDLLVQLDKLDKDSFQALSSSSSLELLRLLRKSKLRRPDVVLRLGKGVLSSGGGGLLSGGGEIWSLYEQIFLAALDKGDSGTAKVCLAKLQAKFPSSSRVSRLIGMQHEFDGEYDEALSVYKKLLEENPSNLLVLKRRVSVYKAQRQWKRSLEELNEIIKLYTSDAACWQELGEIHLRLGDFPSAAFCFEELVLMDANCPHYHTRLADTYYSIGGLEGYLKARKHYTLSLAVTNAKLNVRALYGQIAACRAFAEAVKQDSGSSSAVISSSSTSAPTADKTLMTKEDVDVNTELLKWSIEQVKTLVPMNSPAIASFGF